MYSYIFNHCSSRRSDGLHILILRLPARPFSGWWRGGCSSLLYPAKTVKFGFHPSIIYFYKLCLNTMNICFRWLLRHVQYWHLLKVSALIFRVLFSLDISDVFLEESPKWSANVLNCFHASWRLCSFRSLQGSPILTPVLQVSYRSSGGASFWGISIVSKLSLILVGSLKFSEGLFRSCECVLRSLLPDFSSCCLLTKKVSMGRFPLLWRILNVAVFTLFMWGAEDKNRETRIIG